VDLDITRASAAHRDRVVATIVAAFACDPAFRHFFPDDTTYERHAATFAGYLFDKRVQLGTVWLAGAADAVALWDPPHPPVDDTWSRVELPDDVRERIDRYDRAVHALLPAQPYWYLGVLARHPSVAGRGWGRLLLAAGVTTAHADGLPAYLETASESNVEFYRHAGWEVVGTVPDAGLPTWLLTNRPYRTDPEDVPALARAES
jgi:GNAT superfamily N-acetyltransferase